MEIKKPNDILVATLNNPELTPYDLLSNNINGEDASLLSKEEYKGSKYVQDAFKKEDGKFDDIAFDQVYKLAQNNFYQMTNDEYLKGLDEIEYSPFDITRPKFAKTIKVGATLEKEYNPFKEYRGWTGIGSVDSSNLSLRELAQQGRIFDPKTNSWSDESLNDLSLLDKLFGETLVYAQYDDDGVHLDNRSGSMINHKKGDWKVDNQGNLFIEKLAGREIYGKQVVNPMDTLTTDGSLVNKFDFLDSDGREKSIAGTAFKVALEIAPFLIPSFGVLAGASSIPSIYGGIKAAIGLTTAMPTLYKSLEGLLMGDSDTTLTKGATDLEGWMAKFTQSSVSDEASQSLFNVEQMTGMVGDIFSQIYEQRAAASLARAIYRGDKAMTEGAQRMANEINKKLLNEVVAGKIDFGDMENLSKAAMAKIPELESLISKQSQLSKALSLGYMAITSTSDIYGQAILGGYDRRTAGFAALAASVGQYGIMMNNKMGTWFLDKTTGYSAETNKALIRKSVLPWLDDVEKGFKSVTTNVVEGKKQLGTTFGKIKNSIKNTFTTPSIIGEAMWKNALIEGAEEVTEQVVLDATKGIVDTMSYLGLTKKKGSLGGWDTVFSQAGFENYLANFVGGIIGGGMFEFHRAKIAPWLDPSMLSSETQKSVYELVAAGKKDELISVINSKRSSFGNKYITAVNPDGTFKAAGENDISQADLIANRAIDMINIVDGILNNYDLIKSDEEIVSKTIRDQIIINDLKKATAEGSNIGLEGLVLEDYKTKMSEIVRLEGKIKNTPDTEDNKNILKSDRAKLKSFVDSINDIQEGKLGSEYFGRAELYLNKQIHAPFLKISKTDYTTDKYKVNYHSLPESGEGLTKETIDKEWEEYLDSKDLKKDLETAYNVYKAIEQTFNEPIAGYAESGYDVVRKETLKNIIDLQATINTFNTSGTIEEKNAALERFIEINNKIEGSTLAAPWTILHNDMYNQLNSLGLIKKVNYTKNEAGKWEVGLEDFNTTELDEEDVVTKKPKREKIKNIIQQYFKQFPLNPLNAEVVIKNIGVQIDAQNTRTLDQIEILEQKVDKTQEDVDKIEALRNSLINFKIDSFSNTSVIQSLIKDTDGKISELLTNNGFTAEQLNSYKLAKSEVALYKKDFKELLSDFGVEDWTTLDAVGLKKLIDSLIKSGLYDHVIEELTRISKDAAVEVANNLMLLNNDEITPEQLAQIKNSLEPFINTLKNLVDNNNALLENKDLEKTEVEINKLNSDLSNRIKETTPEILRIHNYALDLLIKTLEAGNADKEVFLEAEKLANDEMKKVVSATFPDITNLSYETFNKILVDIPVFLENMERNDQEFRGRLEGAYSSTSTLKEVLEGEEGYFKSDPNYTGLFVGLEFLNFIKNNFYEGLMLENLIPIMQSALDLQPLNKTSVDRINKFLELQSKGIKLKSNTLYDFIRKFELTLDSNPSNSVNKVFDILEREETNLKSSSNITNYQSDNIREQDITQAINHLQMVKSVILAMSTTQVSLGEPYGFIQSRINYAQKYNLEDDVLNLKTITSDVATLMSGDVDNLITKLKFLQDLAGFNSGKRMNEEEIVRGKVESILLKKWNNWIQKMNPSFLPLDELKEILNSSSKDTVKLMNLENAIFEHNKDKKEDALEEFLKHLQNVNPDVFSQIDKDVSDLESWDLAVYFATIIATRAEDSYIRSLTTIKGTFNKAPFYTQEFAARIAKASIVNPTLFAKIYAIKQNTIRVAADFITVILGGAGTGKSSTVIGLLLDNVRQTNDETKLWISAPTVSQRDILSKTILDSAGTAKIATEKSSKWELFEKLGLTEIAKDIQAEISTINDLGKSTKYVRLSEEGHIVVTEELLKNDWITPEIIEKMQSLPNLLVIDEITHFSSFEMYLLNAISKYSYMHDNLNFMKIIAAGDPTQLGHLVKVESEYYNYNVDSTNAIFTPRLWVSVRSSNNQKRINDERLKRVVSEVSEIYEKNPASDTKAEDESLTYLRTVEDLNILSYHQKADVLTGDKIISSFDKEHANLIASILKKNSKATFGFITRNGQLPEEWNRLLTDAGLVNPESMSNITIFDPFTVQGSERDYFVFETDLIMDYSKMRDRLKAFYTFVSRSSIASIVVDPNKILENFSISNGKMDGYTTFFEPLTESVIKTAKEKRTSDLISILGENPVPSSDDNFKWKVAGGTSEGIAIDAPYVTQTPDNSATTTPLGFSPEEKEIEDKLQEKNFRVMFHSFYNNKGAVINETTGEIIVNNNNIATDLNFPFNVTGDKTKAVVKDWLKLKNYLLNHKSAKSVISSDYGAFFSNAFTGLDNEVVDVELVLTASRYDDEINNPYKKQGYDPDATLKRGEVFMNLSAKLTYGQATHYVTLASMATEKQIIDQAAKYKVSADKISNRFREIEKAIDQSSSKMISFPISNIDSFDFITSTRLVKVKENPKSKEIKEFTLDTLSEEFPGMNFSGIRFFPNNYQRFKDLLRKYTFGSERFTGAEFTPEMTEASLKKLWWGNRDKDGLLIKDTNGKTYTGLRNKPYIVASSNTDLDGDIVGTKTQATIIAIGSHSRGLDVLIKEVGDLLDERKEEVSNSFKTGEPLPPSARIDAKSETLLNRSNILDVLIKWGTTPSEKGTLLDLLFEEIEFSISDTITGNKTTVFEIFNKFRQNHPKASLQGLKDVIGKVKDAIKSEGGDFKKTKSKLVSQMVGMSKWHWMFFNIFAYEKIINSTESKEFLEIMAKGQFDEKVFEAFNESKGSTRMKEILSQLMAPLQNFKFFYSIPIKPPEHSDVQAPLNSTPFLGTDGKFSTEFFADKFFINVAPESGRMLLDLNEFLNGTSTTVPTTPVVTPVIAPVPVVTAVPVVTPVVTPAPVIAPIVISGNTDLINSISSKISEDSDKITLNSILGTVSDKLGDEFRVRLQDVIDTESFNLGNDKTKIQTILQRMGFVLKPDGSKITLASIITALNLDKMADRQLIQDLFGQLNSTLSELACFK